MDWEREDRMRGAFESAAKIKAEYGGTPVDRIRAAHSGMARIFDLDVRVEFTPGSPWANTLDDIRSL